MSSDKGPFVICHAVPARRVTASVAAATIVTVLASVVAWNGEVPAWEQSILDFVNDWPDWLEPILWVVQQAGITGAPIIAGLTVFAFTRQWRHFLPFFLVLPLKLGIEKGIVKMLVQRERPFVSVGDSINVRGPAFEGLSFPSGHTTTAFATAVLLSAFLKPKWRPIPIVWAVMVAVSRLYYGEHNFLDVVAGAALGSAFAMALWFFFLNRYVDPQCDCADQ